jgi:hypothetical protein
LEALERPLNGEGIVLTEVLDRDLIGHYPRSLSEDLQVRSQVQAG